MILPVSLMINFDQEHSSILFPLFAAFKVPFIMKFDRPSVLFADLISGNFGYFVFT